MKAFHVVIKTASGCELLSREGYDSKGIARRAWSTATRGAVLLEDGMVIEAKGGTVLAVENELRRSAARLMRELALTSPPDDEAEEERDEEADDEDDEPAPRPYKEPPVVEPVVAAPSKRSAPVRASKPAPVAVEPQAPALKVCEHCNTVAPDHRYDCPTAEIPFGPIEALPPAQEAQQAAPVEPVKAAPVAAVDAPPGHAVPNCGAKGCECARGSQHRANPVTVDLCVRHRVASRNRARDWHTTLAFAAQSYRDGLTARPSNAPVVAKGRAKKALVLDRPARPARQAAPVALPATNDPLDIVRRLGAAVARLGGLDAVDALGAALDGAVKADELAVALGRAGGPVRALAMIDAVLSLEVA